MAGMIWVKKATSAVRRRTVKSFLRLIICVTIINILVKSLISGEFQKISNVISRKTTKFIVITSVLKPTPNVKRLAAQEGWTVVVVGDQKTPKTWYHPNVHYLSVEDQRQLGYSVVELIPFNSYARKMIGYLYAIQRGAEWIYDTDDDIKPFGKGLKQFDYEEEISGLVFRKGDGSATCSNFFQPYAFFGRPDIWPRGFPLQCVKSNNNNNGIYDICKRIPVPAIQQGIVRKDSDVSAPYRFISAGAKNGLDVSFSAQAPPVSLATGVYAPFNSQNTLFHRSAFFAMWLPVSVAFHVTDIWRSYFAQKLMHLIGRSIAFYPVNAMQKRNAHNYPEDYKDENSLYEDAYRSERLLEVWNCTHGNIRDCSIALAEQFAKNGFWSSLDVEIARRWIDDLRKLKYSFPSLTDSIADIRDRNVYNVSEGQLKSFFFKNCHLANVTFRSAVEDQLTYEARAVNAYRELNDWCARKSNLHLNVALSRDPAMLHIASAHTMLTEYRKMALIIIFNKFMLGAQISVLQRMYEPFFAYTIYCGTKNDAVFLRNDNDMFPELKGPINYVHISQEELNGGYFGYYCTTKVLEMRLQNVKGYIVMADDIVFNMWTKFSTDSLVVHHTNNISRGGAVALNKTIELIQKKYNRDSDIVSALKLFKKSAGVEVAVHLSKKRGWRSADFYYLPGDPDYLHMFYVLMELMYEGEVFLEIAIAKFAEGVKRQDGAILTLWGVNRAMWYRYYSDKLLALHPVKIMRLVDNPQRLKNFCSLIGRSKEKLFTYNI